MENKNTENLPHVLSRAMEDQWTFGIHLIDGQLLIANHVESIRSVGNTTWIDVELDEELPDDEHQWRKKVSLPISSILYITDAQS